MSNDEPLDDIAVHDRLCAASDALGDATGKTPHGDTALKAARKALTGLQMGLMAIESANSPDPEEPSRSD
jgi:hypothetical protein